MKSEWLAWKDWRGVRKMESMDCLSCRARFKHMRYFCKIKGIFLCEKSGEEPRDYLLKLWLKSSFSHCIFPDGPSLEDGLRKFKATPAHKTIPKSDPILKNSQLVRPNPHKGRLIWELIDMVFLYYSGALGEDKKNYSYWPIYIIEMVTTTQNSECRGVLALEDLFIVHILR